VINHHAALARLGAERDEGYEPRAEPPPWIWEARRHRLRRALRSVPIGTRIELRIDVPNNAGGGFEQLSGIYADGDCDDIADARQTFLELVAVFLDHVMPLPKE
jgi:hypothetical protein